MYVIDKRPGMHMEQDDVAAPFPTGHVPGIWMEAGGYF